MGFLAPFPSFPAGPSPHFHQQQPYIPQWPVPSHLPDSRCMTSPRYLLCWLHFIIIFEVRHSLEVSPKSCKIRDISNSVFFPDFIGPDFNCWCSYSDTVRRHIVRTELECIIFLMFYFETNFLALSLANLLVNSVILTQFIKSLTEHLYSSQEIKWKISYLMWSGRWLVGEKEKSR